MSIRIGPPAEHHELAGGRGVAAAAVTVADGADALALLTGEGVHQRGLPGPRRADEHERAPRPDEVPEPVEAGTVGRTHRHDVDTERHRLGDSDLGGDVTGEVGLGQHDDRHGPAVPGEDQLTFEPAPVDAAVEPVDEQDVVDVGGQGLRAGRLAGGAADQCRSAGQDLDDALAVGVRATQSPTTTGCWRVGPSLAEGGGDGAAAPVDAGDAAGWRSGGRSAASARGGRPSRGRPERCDKGRLLVREVVT